MTDTKKENKSTRATGHAFEGWRRLDQRSEQMKAADFNLSKDVGFNFETGMTRFKAARLAIFDVNAIGWLRRRAVNELEMEKARDINFKFGRPRGYFDFSQMKLNYQFDSAMDLLASGQAQAPLKELGFNTESGEFYFTGVWKEARHG